jgi:transposase
MSTIELEQKVEQLEKALAEKEKTILSNNILIEELNAKIAVLNILNFGTKSEKWTPEDERQGRLFNEAEEDSLVNGADQIQARVETREVGSYTRRAKNQGRKPLSPDLPRETTTYDIPEDKKICSCGECLTCIGVEKTERLKIKPPEVSVVVEEKLKYACKKCEGTHSDTPGVITAEGEKHLLPGSIATASLLAWTLTEKFCYALPFYRQEKRLAQIGVHIPRATLSGFAIRTGMKCMPIYELLKKHIQSGSLTNADETTVQVLTEPGRKPQDKSFMCVYLGGPQEKKAVVFRYTTTRASKVHKDFLADFKGRLQTDDLAVYHTAVRELNDARKSGEKITHILCWAHARRTFYKAWQVTKSERATRALDFIRSIFELEKLREGRSKNGFYKLRRNRALIIFDEFKSWMLEIYSGVPPSTPLGKALSYTLDNWDQLVTYVDDPDCVPSNNLAENAIRPFVIGRKNWMFFETQEGAEASAIIYSLIESAKLAGLGPYDYLLYLFEKLPYAVTEEDLIALLPFNLTPEQIKPSRS